MSRPQRVGLLIPSSNTMMEVDFTRGLPDGVSLHTGRMYMEDTTEAGENRMLDEFALPAARDVGTARPDVIVFGCTSAGALRGNDYDTELCARISEIAGCPAISTIASVRAAIAASGASRVGVFTPYIDLLNQRIAASIEADGVNVVRIAGMGITENFAIAEVTTEQIVDFAVDSLSGAEIDLAFASCTNYGAVAALPALRQRLGVPVISSNQAVLSATISALDTLSGD